MFGFYIKTNFLFYNGHTQTFPCLFQSMTVVISHFVDLQITGPPSKTKCFPFNYFVKQTAAIPKIGI